MRSRITFKSNQLKMPDNFENRYDDTKKQIDALDKSIDDLSKNQERIDFTERVQEVKNIYDSFVKLDKDISSITDENKKNELKKRLDDLKIKMLDLVSDGSIDNLIDWKTKDEFINKEIMKVNDLFFGRMETLIKSLEIWNEKIDEIIAEPLTGEALVGTLWYLWIPFGEISIEWKKYLWFSLDWELYAFDGSQLKMCEPIFDDKDLKSIYWTWGDVSLPKWMSITSSDKLTKASVDNLLLEQKTVKASYDLWNGFSPYASLKTQWLWATPEIWITWKLFNTKAWDVKLNTQLTASYSPWSITWAESWWWKDKDVFKFKAWEAFKFKNGISLSLYEIFKTSDFSKIRSSNLSAELKASRKPKSNISLSAIANFDYKGNPSFVWLWGSIRL